LNHHEILYLLDQLMFGKSRGQNMNLWTRSLYYSGLQKCVPRNRQTSWGIPSDFENSNQSSTDALNPKLTCSTNNSLPGSSKKKKVLHTHGLLGWKVKCPSLRLYRIQSHRVIRLTFVAGFRSAKAVIMRRHICQWE